MSARNATDFPKEPPTDLDEIEAIVTRSLGELSRATDDLRADFAESPRAEAGRMTSNGKPQPLSLWINTAVRFWVNVPQAVPPAVRTIWTQPAVRQLWPRGLTVEAFRVSVHLRERDVWWRQPGPKGLTVKVLPASRCQRVPCPSQPPDEIDWHSITAARPGIDFVLSRDGPAYRAFLERRLRRGLPRGAAAARKVVKECFGRFRKDAERRPECYRLRPRSQDEVNEEVSRLIAAWEEPRPPTTSSPVDEAAVYQLTSALLEYSAGSRKAHRSRAKEKALVEERGPQVPFEVLCGRLRDQWADVKTCRAAEAVEWAVRRAILKTDPPEIMHKGKLIGFAEWFDLPPSDRPPVVLRIPKSDEKQPKAEVQQQGPPANVPDDKGYVETPDDPTVYLSAADVVKKRHTPEDLSITVKQLGKIVQDYKTNRVRWTRPKGKNGQPMKNRRSVHLGDWNAYVERQTGTDEEGFPRQSQGEVEHRKAAVRKAKECRK